MNAPTTVLPEPVATDPIEVADALDVARTLCEQGSLEDALRWLRRAVEAASEASDVTGAARVAALAHAAADLAELASRPSPPSVPSVPSAPTSQIRLASSPRPTPAPTASSRPTQRPPTPKPTSRPSVTVPPPPPALAVRMQTRVRVSVRTSVRDPELWVVRALKENQPVPRGTREAFLVLSETSQACVDNEIGELTDLDVIAVTGSGER